MNRDHARAILANIDLIHHFAHGGDIGHRGMAWDGTPLDIRPTNKIVLGNLKACQDKYYVKVKSKLVWNSVLKTYERHERTWPEVIAESEVIPYEVCPK